MKAANKQFVFPDIQDGHLYTFRVAGENEVGVGAYSEEMVGPKPISHKRLKGNVFSNVMKVLKVYSFSRAVTCTSVYLIFSL